MIEAIDALGTTTASDPTNFAFFKGLNTAAVGGVLSADVKGGLPAGIYKVCHHSILLTLHRCPPRSLILSFPSFTRTEEYGLTAKR